MRVALFLLSPHKPPGTVSPSYHNQRNITMFDVAEFMQSTITEALDTTRIPVPPGDYTAQINSDEKAISVDKGTIGKGDRAGQEWASFVCYMTIPDPSGSIKSQTGRDPVVIRHSVFLDLTPDGKIDL